MGIGGASVTLILPSLMFDVAPGAGEADLDGPGVDEDRSMGVGGAPTGVISEPVAEGVLVRRV